MASRPTNGRAFKATAEESDLDFWILRGNKRRDWSHQRHAGAKIATMTKEELHKLRLSWIAADETYHAAMRAWADRPVPDNPVDAARWRAAWDEMEDLRRSSDHARNAFDKAAVAFVRAMDGDK